MATFVSGVLIGMAIINQWFKPIPGDQPQGSVGFRAEADGFTLRYVADRRIVAPTIQPTVPAIGVSGLYPPGNEFQITYDTESEMRKAKNELVDGYFYMRKAINEMVEGQSEMRKA
jgi:hypothetical protein